VSCARIGRRQVLDVRHLDDRGSSGAATQTACGPQRAGDPAGDDLLLLALLVRAQQLLAEVVVDRRIGRAARRARQRDRRGAQSLAAHSSSGEAATKAASPAAGAEHVAGLEGGAQDPNTAAASCGAGAWTATSRARTIFSNAPARMRSTARATAAS
jgi:hypothetical protein